MNDSINKNDKLVGKDGYKDGYIIEKYFIATNYFGPHSEEFEYAGTKYTYSEIISNPDIGRHDMLIVRLDINKLGFEPNGYMFIKIIKWIKVVKLVNGSKEEKWELYGKKNMSLDDLYMLTDREFLTGKMI